MALSIKRTGIWLYDGAIETAVDIVALDYDWSFRLAEADGMLDDGETPAELGAEGFLYYVRFRRALELHEPTWVDSPAHKRLEDAMSEAEKRVAGGIQWADGLC